MNMRARIWKIGLAVAALASLGLVGARIAEAHGPGAWQHHAEKKIAAILDAAKATPEQRAAVHAARDRVFSVIADIHSGRAADLNAALDLFTADKIDAQKVEALRAKHQAELRRAADAIVQAVTEVHDTLDAGQRKAIV